MKQIKKNNKIKKLASLLMIICMSILVTACNSSETGNENSNGDGEMAFVFSVSTGDNVEIAVNSKVTKNNDKEDEILLKQYNGNETNVVYSSKDNDVISNCNFIQKEHYDQVVANINDETNTNIQLINKGTRKNKTENFDWYEYTDTSVSETTTNSYILNDASNKNKQRVNYVIWLNKGNTGVLISSAKSQKQAEFIFSQMKIRLKKLS